MAGASALGCLVRPVSWVRCPWWPFGRRIYSRLRGGLGSGHVVLTGTFSTGGCVGFLPLFETMSGWVVCGSLMGWGRCPGWWLVGRCWICSRRLCRGRRRRRCRRRFRCRRCPGLRVGVHRCRSRCRAGCCHGGWGAGMERVVERMGFVQRMRRCPR